MDECVLRPNTNSNTINFYDAIIFNIKKIIRSALHVAFVAIHLNGVKGVQQ